MVTRREFCAFAALGAADLLARRRDRVGTLRVGVIAGAGRAHRHTANALDGLLFGAAEARRTSALFGGDVSLVRHDVSSPDDAAAAAADLRRAGVAVLATALGRAATTAVATSAQRQHLLALHVAAWVPAPSDASPPWNLWLAPPPSTRARAVMAALHTAETLPPVDSWAVWPEDGATREALLQLDRSVATELGKAPLLAGIGAPSGKGALLLAAPEVASTALPDAVDAVVIDPYGVTEAAADFDARRVVRADAWTPSLERFGAAQLNDRFRERFGASARMEGPAWGGWFAMKMLAEAALRAGTGDVVPLRDALLRSRFDGHKGTPLSFSGDGVLSHPLYVTGLEVR